MMHAQVGRRARERAAFDADHPSHDRAQGPSTASFTVRKITLSVPGAARRAPDSWIARRGRAMVRVIRGDTPMLWRVAAHSAVLVLTLGVLVVSRGPSFAAMRTESGGEDQIGLWARQATAFIPSPVLDTVAAGGNREANDDTRPGFVSPGAIAEADQSLLPWDKPEVHVLKYGDTLSSIAAAYGIEPLWLLWANPDIQKNPDNVALGTELTVLPMKAVVHIVKEGDTVASVAETYGASAEDIVTYAANGLAEGGALTAGARVIVPGGESDVRFPQPVVEMAPRSIPSWSQEVAGVPAVGSGSFGVAAYGRITSTFTRRHRAVDIANRTGTPIMSTDGGTVVVAGWYGWAGKAVKIDHGNGYVSLYAHMSSINVSPGQSVQRGQVLGGIGCTRGRGGYCSGPHLHLEIYFQGRPINPCSVGACY